MLRTIWPVIRTVWLLLIPVYVAGLFMPAPAVPAGAGIELQGRSGLVTVPLPAGGSFYYNRLAATVVQNDVRVQAALVAFLIISILSLNAVIAAWRRRREEEALERG